MLPPNVTEFAIDPDERNKELRLGSVTVKILATEETSIKYSLSFESKAP